MCKYRKCKGFSIKILLSDGFIIIWFIIRCIRLIGLYLQMYLFYERILVFGKDISSK